jgi:hypothetical protein
MPPRPEPPQGGGDQGGGDKAERKAPVCPICGKPAEQVTKPFCSSRCRDVDLHRWFSGSYVVPGADDDTEED